MIENKETIYLVIIIILLILLAYFSRSSDTFTTITSAITNPINYDPEYVHPASLQI